MLKKRIIPKLLIDIMSVGNSKRPVLVRTRKFDEKILVGDPISQARIYEAQMADELCLQNITGTPLVENPQILAAVEKMASELFMPLAVGGGVSGSKDISRLLELGADKVILNSAALENPSILTDASRQFGAQCIVVAIDFTVDEAGKAMVMTNRGKNPTGWDLVGWSLKAVEMGAGELLLTSIGDDGSNRGLNLEKLHSVASMVPVPVIGCGGVGLAEHFSEGFKTALLEGVSAGTFFTKRDQNPMQARAHVLNAGVPIRYKTH